MEQLQPNISLSQTTELKCECGNDTFVEAFLLRKVSRLITGGQKDSLLPVSVFICTKDQKILPDTYPTELNNNA